MKKETGKQIIKPDNKSISGDLIGDIRSLIETARHNVAITVNAGLTILYWQIGSRIRQDILKEKLAEYGKEIVATLSRQLTDDYGNNFNEKNLRRMIQFAEVFPDKEIVVSLIRQLSWTHFIALILLKMTFNVISTLMGLILCAGKTSEQIELLRMNTSGIKVAEYMTELPKCELLEQKTHKAVELARKRLEANAAQRETEYK